MDLIVLGIVLSSCTIGGCVGYIWQSIMDAADDYSGLTREERIWEMHRDRSLL